MCLNYPDQLYASIAGVAEKVNKFVTVRPLRARYNGDVGDVVVGRIKSVQQTRWKVEVDQSKNEYTSIQLSPSQYQSLHIHTLYLSS